MSDLEKRRIKTRTTIRIFKQASLIALAAGAAFSVLAPAVLADNTNCLSGPRQPVTLRNPLVAGAPATAPNQAPITYYPPPPGSGPVPNPVIPGDPNLPSPVTTGYADWTHGNIFPASGSQDTQSDPGFIPGAGRYPTKNGQQQGLYDYGQGMQYGIPTYEPGSGNAGMPTYESGYPNMGMPTYDYGQGIQGIGTYESGAPNGGVGTYESGGQVNGTPTYESGIGNGGISRIDYGGSNGGTPTYDSGIGNGGTPYYSGQSIGGGTPTYDSGIGNGGTPYIEGGAGNGATQTIDSGMQSIGTGITNNGGARIGSVTTVNNGGALAGAQETSSTAGNTPSNAYNFQGPLPTVRTFCRYLVILGVVCATVWVALAAVSVVMGNANGPARVIGAVGGLLLLLAGYTIWKVVQMDTFGGNNGGGSSSQHQYNAQVEQPTASSTLPDPGQTSPILTGGYNQQDARQYQGPNNFRPTGPYLGHMEGPDRVGIYNIPSSGVVPEPPKMPVINPNGYSSQP